MICYFYCVTLKWQLLNTKIVAQTQESPLGLFLLRGGHNNDVRIRLQFFMIISSDKLKQDNQ